MNIIYTVTGKLTDDRTVALDESLPLAQMKVRLVVQPLTSSPHRPYREVLAEIRVRQQTRGYEAPSRDEVDASLQVERESWEE